MGEKTQREALELVYRDALEGVSLVTLLYAAKLTHPATRAQELGNGLFTRD